MKRAVTGIGFVVASSLIVCIGMAALQGKMVFYPEKDMDPSPDSYGLAYEDVWMDAGGDQIHGWFVPAESARGTVLFFHGNAGNLSHRQETIRFWNRRGFDLLIVDYRGYGRSEGKPTEAHTYEDALAAWAWLTETRGVAPDRIVIHGRSLGGAIAAYLATERTPGALILESTFTSVRNMAKQVVGFVPAKWAVRIKYDTESRVTRLTCPALIGHSPVDDVIPFEHGKAVFAAAAEPKTWLTLVGPHNGGWRMTDDYADQLEAFLSAHGFAATRPPE